MKIEFFLMNEKGFEVIKEVFNEFGGTVIAQVILARDTAVVKDYYDEMVSFCQKNHIKFFDKKYYKSQEDAYKIAIGWRWLIKDNSKLIIFHDSLLPKYRGFAPLVNILINGETEAGVSAIFASNEYDCGDIISQFKFTFSYPMKIAELIQQVAKLYVECCKDVISKIKTNSFSPVKQDNSLASYSVWRDEEDYFIKWTLGAEKIKRFIDAVGFPYKGALTYMGDDLITILDAQIAEDVNVVNREENIGKLIFLIDGRPVIICGEGLLVINKAIFVKSGQSIFPVTKFRVRFKNKAE